MPQSATAQVSETGTVRAMNAQTAAAITSRAQFLAASLPALTPGQATRVAGLLSGAHLHPLRVEATTTTMLRPVQADLYQPAEELALVA